MEEEQQNFNTPDMSQIAELSARIDQLLGLIGDLRARVVVLESEP